MGGQIKEFKTNHLEALIIDGDTNTDMGFVTLVFGDYKKSGGTKKRKIKIVTYAEVEQVATTGDFFASATVVRNEDNMTEIEFRPPEINEKYPMSAEDEIEVECAGDPGQAAIALKERQRAEPVGVLNRRRERFIAQSAGTMALTGSITHHLGTIDLGFTNIEVLAGANVWTDPAADPIRSVNLDYDAMDEKPDALFGDALAIELLLKGAVETSNGSDGKSANFTRAIKADIDRLSPSKTVRFVGTILECGLDVFKVTTKVVQRDSSTLPLFPDNTILFAPVDDRSAARIIFGGIPKVSDSLNPAPTTEKKNERWYVSVNDTETIATVGILSAPCPIMRNPKKFRKVKVA